MRIDGFASVFSLNLYRYPQAGEPPAAAPVEQLLITMGVNGVDAAVIVQPPQYGLDHSYLSAALEMYPDKVRAICAAGSPAIGQAGVIGARFDSATLSAHAEAAQRVLDAGKLIYLTEPADVSGLEGGRFFLEVPRSAVTRSSVGRLLTAARDPRIGILVVGDSPAAADFAEALAGLEDSLGGRRLAWGSGFPGSGASEGYAAAIAGLAGLNGGLCFDPADPAKEPE
ncbi:MAG: hypothetical protein F4Y67_08190 [Chloroflexi bacterium]|nr:hypothetical protein [Chloroflexota bacterium]